MCEGNSIMKLHLPPIGLNCNISMHPNEKKLLGQLF